MKPKGTSEYFLFPPPLFLRGWESGVKGGAELHPTGTQRDGPPAPMSCLPFSRQGSWPFHTAQSTTNAHGKISDSDGGEEDVLVFCRSLSWSPWRWWWRQQESLNVGKRLSDYTASEPRRRQPSTYILTAAGTSNPTQREMFSITRGPKYGT